MIVSVKDILGINTEKENRMTVLLGIILTLAGGFGGYLLNDAIDNRPDVTVNVAVAQANASAKSMSASVSVSGTRSSGSIIVLDSAVSEYNIMILNEDGVTNYYTALSNVPAEYSNQIANALQMIPNVPAIPFENLTN
jgi:hypothetical protein